MEGPRGACRGMGLGAGLSLTLSAPSCHRPCPIHSPALVTPYICLGIQVTSPLLILTVAFNHSSGRGQRQGLFP